MEMLHMSIFRHGAVCAERLCVAATPRLGIVYRSSAALIQCRPASVPPAAAAEDQTTTPVRSDASYSWKRDYQSFNVSIKVTKAKRHPQRLYVESRYKVSTYYVEKCLTGRLRGASWLKRLLTLFHPQWLIITPWYTPTKQSDTLHDSKGSEGCWFF